MGNFYFPVLQFLCLLSLVSGQGSSISFSPDSPLCVGEEVEMVCFVETSEQFRTTDAQVSINSSVPFAIAPLNSNSVLDGIDLSRYRANLDGLSISTSRPGIRLIINSYQPSDSDTVFGCHGEFTNFTVSPVLVSRQPNSSAAPPSAPSLQSSVSNFNTATCSADISLSWNTPPSDRTIDRYFLYLDESPLATTNSNSYIHSTILNINTDYQYSVTAMSCAGNSTTSSNNVNSVKSYTLMKSSQPVCLTYNNVTGRLMVNWGLSTPTQPSGVSGLDITYSLQLLYSHSRQNVTYTYSNSTSFTLPSSQLSYNTVLTAHNFTQLDGVETNITANLTIVQQCGQSFNGKAMECFYNSKNPPTPPITTSSFPISSTTVEMTNSSNPMISSTSLRINSSNDTPTPTIPITPTTPTTPTIPTIIIGSAVGAAILLFILVTFIILLLILIFFLRKRKANHKQTGTNGTDAKDYQELEDTNSEVKKKPKHKPEPVKKDEVELTYLEIDHSSGTGKIVKPPIIPKTNYADINSFPQETQYASLQN